MIVSEHLVPTVESDEAATVGQAPGAYTTTVAIVQRLPFANDPRSKKGSRMETDQFHALIKARIGDAIEIDAEAAAHAVLGALSRRLTPEEASELAPELPDGMGELIADASGQHAFDRDEFIEDVAARLDLDDVDAERVALAVLAAVRAAIDPSPTVEQVIEALPTDLAQLMHAAD